MEIRSSQGEPLDIPPAATSTLCCEKAAEPSVIQRPSGKSVRGACGIDRSRSIPGTAKRKRSDDKQKERASDHALAARRSEMERRSRPNRPCKKVEMFVDGAIPASKGVRNDMGPLGMMTNLLFPVDAVAVPRAFSHRAG